MKKYIDAEGVMRACFDSYAKTGNSAYKEIFELVSQMGEDMDEETRGILYANGHPVCAIVNGKVVEVQEVRRGSWLPDKWIADREDVLRLVLKCSLCGGQVDGLVDYCPHCGAIMSEEEDE